MAFKQPNLSPLILERFLGILGVAFQFYRSLGFHLVRWRVKVQQILSTRSWGSKPSLLLGFITIVGEVHIILFSLFLGLSQLFLVWNEAIIVFFNFLIFFAIFLEFFVTGRVGTDRNDNFFFFTLSQPFPTCFDLKRRNNHVL